MRVPHPRALAPVALVAVLSVLLVGGTATTPAALAGRPIAVAARSASALGPARIPTRARIAAHAHTAASHGPTVTAALASLRRSGAITPAVYQKDYAAYLAAVNSLKKLGGTRRNELGAVVANVRAIAAAGGFIPSRLGALFLTLERNRTWWTSGSLLASRVRISFPGSELVWEYYAGQGIEIQWLGTFGEGNGYYSGGQNNNLKQLVSELIPLATARAGGIAWEYMFQFDGGKPPWTSGLSQGTALQVLSRDYSRFKEPAVLKAAQEALGIFKTPPPSGVRVASSFGAHYLEYTYAPTDRILNGELQALVGLYDYTSLTKDPAGLALFEAGDAEERVRTPLYNTGYWSMYDQYGESDLNYHELLTEFLQHLCERTRKGEPLATTPAPAPAPATPTTPTTPTTPPAGGTPGGTTGTGGTTGGASAARYTARAASTTTTPATAQIAGDQIYCTTAEAFTADEHTPPKIALLTTKLPTSARAGVQLSLSKVATVHLTVRLGGTVVYSNSATVERGKPKLLWPTPSKGGSYTVTLTATDLAGNFATASGTITVAKGA
ncbi:MAG TPA: D-glucuronyl C5-epimerase family protein [Gaiellaceae bacterium]|nr:D-glucuronyl C5-epimerase family protein [Gaiellaceae bacterium]